MQLALVLWLATPLAGLGSARTGSDADHYERDIKPLLSRRCVPCHGPLRQESGLRLDTGALALRGGDSGPALTPGNAGASLIVARILSPDASESMPQEAEPLPAGEVELIRRWIDDGAAFPESEQPVPSPDAHWSYQSPSRPRIPAIPSGRVSSAETQAAPRTREGEDRRSWIRNPVDAFIARKLDEHQLVPAPEAAPAVLARRLYLDLAGRPPTRDELNRFVADRRPDAYERLVDVLLAGPEYGQRWGRHWMDIWRYSDWYGRRGQDEIRYSQRHIWRWRDWIIDALNRDHPYDRMLIEMLAGDEVAPADAETLRATGFLGRNWYKFDRNTWLFDTVEHTAAGLLAITMRCARCHDHKYEPISQEDYYRYRAFFEPYDVRIDASPGGDPAGVARVYDAHAEVPTFLFARGDDRQPVRERPLTAAFPVSLDKSGTAATFHNVALPAEAFYPALQAGELARLRAEAGRLVREAEAHRDQIDARLARLLARRDQPGAAGERPSAAEPILVDDFGAPREDLWRVVTGQWKYDGGRLVQAEVGSFRSLVSRVPVTGDFQARMVYTTTDPGTVHSVGFSFDATESLGDWQAIYTHVQDGKSAIHAFHRSAGRDVYPPEAIVDGAIELGKPVVLDVAVRGRALNVWVDGRLSLAYNLPVARRDGLVSLWVHSGTASFDELRVERLPESVVLAGSAGDPIPSPFLPWSPERLALEIESLEQGRRLADAGYAAGLERRTALEARIAAALAETSGGAEAGELAARAASAERKATVADAEVQLAEAERALAQAATQPESQRQELEKNLAQARKQLDDAHRAAAEPGTRYQPLGDVYPATSTGRRLALARWMTDRTNPRTSRVAVNHIWMRHFGVAIVPSVANFGISGQAPSHPELLDWLAVELMSTGWSMKHVHRLIVTSAAYRMASDAPGGAEGPVGDGGFLARMPRRRMEAEVVRDSLLSIAGSLDVSLGGPELDEKLGESSRRRSLYFRTTPDNKMLFLELFDLANPNQCYERQSSVIPQQALALFNSTLAAAMAGEVARRLTDDVSPAAGGRPEFIHAAFETVLSRPPHADEREACLRFLERYTTTSQLAAPSESAEIRARQSLILVLLNHNDFVTIR